MGSKIGLDRFRANKDEGEPRVGAPQTQTTHGEIEIEIEDLESGRKTITRSKEELKAFLESELRSMFTFLECKEVDNITMWRNYAKVYVRKVNPDPLFSEYELERFFKFNEVTFEVFKVWYVGSHGYVEKLSEIMVLTAKGDGCYQTIRINSEELLEDILSDLGLRQSQQPTPKFSLEL